MKQTRTVRNGRGCIAHNERTGKDRTKVSHIDFERTKDNRVMFKQYPDELTAYKEIYGDYIEQRNAKAKHEGHLERMITVEQYKQLHPCKETLLQIGNMNTVNESNKEDLIDALMFTAIEFQDRYGDKLKILGVYIHLDEATPHVHIDYLPVDSKGKYSLNGALKELGFDGVNTKYDNPVIRFSRANDDLLEEVARNYNIDIDKGVSKGMHHLETELYKKTKQLDDVELKMQNLQQELANANKEVAIAQEQTRIAKQQYQEFKGAYEKCFSYLQTHMADYILANNPKDVPQFAKLVERVMMNPAKGMDEIAQTLVTEQRGYER